MGFMPPFFSGSSAAPECVASSNPVSVGCSEQVLGSRSVVAWVRAAQSPEGTERLLLEVHQRVGRRPVLSAGVRSRARSRGKQPFCRSSSVSFCQALARDDPAQAWLGTPERGVPL